MPQLDFLMATYIKDTDIQLLSDPDHHVRKPINREAIKKRMEKMRASALSNDEPYRIATLRVAQILLIGMRHVTRKMSLA